MLSPSTAKRLIPQCKAKCRSYRPGNKKIKQSSPQMSIIVFFMTNSGIYMNSHLLYNILIINMNGSL